MNTELIKYIENSFLSSLLTISSVTDISYNGKEIYYQDNFKGRTISEIKISDQQVYDFIRQIANLSDNQFSYSNPILDISCGRYRINATHYIISRKEREKVINFSIRIGYDYLRIKDDDDFIKKKCLKLVDLFIKNKQSIVISGVTSSGKTEFQKFLISRIEKNSRLVVIDNVDELETDYFLKGIDSQTWLLNENLKISFDVLIKNALRVNPDWIIVSEARGGEMLSLLNSSMTGHPTISTIHSKDISFDYQRMTRMCMIKNPNLKFDETLIDIYDHFKLVIHVSRETNEKGEIIRHVKKIGTNINDEFYPLFEYPNKFYQLPDDLRTQLDISLEEFEKIKEEYSNG